MTIGGICDRHQYMNERLVNKDSLSSSLKTEKECSYLRLILPKSSNKPFAAEHGIIVSVFERIASYRDIVYINYLDEIGNIIETIYMPWSYNDVNDTDNDYQRNEISVDYLKVSLCRICE